MPAGLSLGVCTGVPLGVGSGLARGEPCGVTWGRRQGGTGLAVSSGCSLWSRTGERGNGMASLGGTVRGERRARGLWRMGEGSGWYGEQGVEGSDWTEDGGGPVCGRGLERVVCRLNTERERGGERETWREGEEDKGERGR